MNKSRSVRKQDLQGVYVIAVGYEQEAKCHLLNTLNGGDESFKQFMCRTNPFLKRVRNETISGRDITLVLTASINSPAWAKMSDKFLTKWKERTCVFVYVTSTDSKADDTRSIETLKATFSQNFHYSILCYKKINTNHPITKKLDGIVQHKFQLDASFQDNVGQARDILQKLKTLVTICKVSLHTSGPSEVGAEKQESLPEKSHAEDAVVKEAFQHAATVDVPKTDIKLGMKENLTQQDWIDFQNALRYGKARSNIVRVNVVGNHGVGKTTLINRLLMKKVLCPDPNSAPTENLEVHRVTIRCSERNGTKYWEKEEKGDASIYLEDLNIQRMAQALQSMEASSPEDYMGQSGEIITEPMSDEIPVKWKTPVKHNSDHEGQVITKDKEEQNFHDFQKGSEEVEDDGPSLDYSPAAPKNEYSVLSSKEYYLRKVLYCKELLMKEKNEKIYVSFWDYAGQSTYYATHHLFISPSAVYLLVIDLRQELDDMVTDNLQFQSGVLQSCTVADALKFWTRSIQTYTRDEHGGSAPTIIIGTHRDHVKDMEKIEAKFKEIRKLLKTNAECIAIDNMVEPEKDDSYSIIKNKIIDVGLGVIDEKVSAQWINLDYDMQRSSLCNKGYISFSDLRKIDKEMDVPLCNDVRLEAFLCHQHHRGHLLFFQHPELKNLIITNPTIMINFLNGLFRRPDTGSSNPTKGLNEDGILNHEYLIDIARKLQIEEFAYMSLLKTLVQLHILHPMPSETEDYKNDQYIVPYLLPSKTFSETSDNDECWKSPLFQVRFKPDDIHQATFHQIVCALLKTLAILETEDKREIYNLNVILNVKDSLVLLFLSWEHSRLVFFIEDFTESDDSTLSKLVDEVILLIEEAIENVLFVNRNEHVDYSLQVECPIHTRAFLPMKDLKDKSIVLCNVPGVGRHRVTIQEIKCIVVKESEKQPDDPILSKRPTDMILGRLARKIQTLGLGESAFSLAYRLKLPCAFAKADIITRDLDDPGTEFLHVLITWRSYSGSEDRTNGRLLRLVTKRNVYDYDTMKEAMFAPVVPDPRIDTIPAYVSTNNRDIRIICQYFGRGYTFALVEMGIEWIHIDQERIVYRDNVKELIYQLLLQWKRRNPEKSTLKRILEAAKMTGIPIDGIIAELRAIRE